MKKESETDKLWHPCRNCTERTPGCHAECERYRKARQLITDARAKDRKFAEADEFKALGVQRVRKKCYRDKFKKG